MNFLNMFAAGMGSSAAQQRYDQLYAQQTAQQTAQQLASQCLALQSEARGYAMGRPSAPIHVATKCHGCGSHEWRQHNNVRICAYCRSGQ